MNDKNLIEQFQNRISVAKLLLFDAQTFIKFGALASDSCIEDSELQLHTNFDDYYILLKSVNLKVQEAIRILDKIEN